MYQLYRPCTFWATSIAIGLLCAWGTCYRDYHPPLRVLEAPVKLAPLSHSLNPQILALAIKAHQKADRLGLVRKPLITIIDYSLPSNQPRLWVVDAKKRKVLHYTYVAHGKGSGTHYAKIFSNTPGSLQSSLGVFITGKTYRGKHGLSLVLHGAEKGINHNAQRRAIVMHPAHYVKKGYAGRSWGCPALSKEVARPIIQAIQEGSLLFAYYPDKHWLKQSLFLS